MQDGTNIKNFNYFQPIMGTKSIKKSFVPFEYNLWYHQKPGM